MDKLKDMAGKMGGGKKTDNSSSSAGKDDYLDKGLAAGEKKFGVPQNKGANEKITDSARDQFEKYSGKDVPDKVSN
ncbi:MAG: hypothetical protein M1831_005276 [Alyxoria varia]|nr:MAG: hypothetical protein M1831_005276 [Alyxoria varia]